MLKTLQKKELLMVFGGNFFDFFDLGGCMGSGRDQLVTCYNSSGKAVRGWKARSWSCAKWFCCSGDKGQYSHVVMGKEYLNCHSDDYKILQVANPANLKKFI